MEQSNGSTRRTLFLLIIFILILILKPGALAFPVQQLLWSSKQIGTIIIKINNLSHGLDQRKMFRNIYIQAYKNSIQQNSTLQMMLIHANHIYAGLGCILQDIQFMVGNVLAYFKTSADGTKRVKNETKQRISMPEKLQEISFKMPKYQFLPSSSFKYENFEIPRPKFNQPEQIRSNNIQQSVNKRNDSFEEMFPQKRKTRPSMESSDNEKSKKPFPNPPAARNDPSPSPQSQEDFMDYLFKKKNKD